MSKSTFLEDSDIAKAIADNIRNRRDGKPLHMIPIRNPYVFMNGKPSGIVYENAVDIYIPKYSYIRPRLCQLLEIYSRVRSEGRDYIEADHGESTYYCCMENMKNAVSDWISKYKDAIYEALEEHTDVKDDIKRIIDSKDWDELADKFYYYRSPIVTTIDDIVDAIEPVHDDAADIRFESAVIRVTKKMCEKYEEKIRLLQEKIRVLNELF